MTSSAFTLAFTLALAACSITSSKSPQENPGLKLLQIDEAFLRFLFEHNSSGQQSHAAVYCIGIGKLGNLADPDNRLLRRLSDLRPSIVPASHCKYDIEVTSRASGRRSLIFNIESVKCRTDALCEVIGGYLEGNLSADGGTYIAERHNRTWIIHNPLTKWIS